LPKEELWICHFLLFYSNCSQLGGGVSRDVSTDHKETANQDILLGQKFQSRQIVGAESCKVCHHNGENEGKAAAINASDACGKKLPDHQIRCIGFTELHESH
jgi:hypothetical protein